METEKDFYELLIEKFQQPWKTIDFYSISACFAFYSRGMETFSKVLQGMAEVLERSGKEKIRRMRILLYSDKNPIDEFGINRFHKYLQVLEPHNLVIHRLDEPKKEKEWIQFVIFDENETIFTEQSTSKKDLALDIYRNIMKHPPKIITKKANNREFREKQRLFEEKWKSTRPFDNHPIPTPEGLADFLIAKFPLDPKEDWLESNYEDQLYHMLVGKYDASFISRQFKVGNYRVDLTIGENMAIELKLAKNINELKAIQQLIGQISCYAKHFNDILVVIVGKTIKSQYLKLLKTQFENSQFAHVHILQLK